MSKSIIDILNYGPEALTRHFNVAAESVQERAAMRFLHKVMSEELGSCALNRAESAHEAAKASIEKIDYRLRLFRQYQADFFSDMNMPDREALIIAVICDEYSSAAQEPLEGNENGDVIFKGFKDNGFDDHTLGCACYFWEEAVEIESTGDVQTVSREGHLLAHINGLQNLKDHRDNFEAYKYADLDVILDNDIMPLFIFADLTTDIGKRLSNEAMEMKQRIEACFTPSMQSGPPKKERPALRVVETPPALEK